MPQTANGGAQLVVPWPMAMLHWFFARILLFFAKSEFLRSFTPAEGQRSITHRRVRESMRRRGGVNGNLPFTPPVPTPTYSSRSCYRPFFLLFLCQSSKERRNLVARNFMPRECVNALWSVCLYTEWWKTQWTTVRGLDDDNSGFSWSEGGLVINLARQWFLLWYTVTWRYWKLRRRNPRG